jgi:hypothetical protein
MKASGQAVFILYRLAGEGLTVARVGSAAMSEDQRPGQMENDEALDHQAQALDALERVSQHSDQVAVVHALLTVAARIEELTAIIANRE